MEADSRPFHSPGFFIRAASTPWEAAGCSDLRRRVFVEEQRIFEDHDRDDIDMIATHLVALSTYAHEPDSVVGTVRIHEQERGLWWGSRLAVDPDYRRVGRLGTELIRLAVSTANARGCHRFLANVQMQNVILFRRLHWHPVGEVELQGVTHMRMAADLAHYPATYDPEAGWYLKALKVAA